MKRAGRLMEKISDLDNLYLAYAKARRGKMQKNEVVKFSENLDDEIRTLKKELETETVEVGNYRYFTIYDPKERLICAASFKERVLHHAIMNVCHEYFDKTLIDTTYATRKGKGVYAAIDKAKKTMKCYDYVVKLDYRKFYDSINHELLYEKLCKKFKDKALLRLFRRIIDSYEVTPGCGLPIGNLTSQYFANNYLSSLDHFIKEQLHIPAYVRYMDDMLLACNSRVELKNAVATVMNYSHDKLNLRLKTPVFRLSSSGIDFLGYKIYSHHLELSGRSKRRYRNKLVLYEKYLNTGKWNETEYRLHVVPALSFTEYAECRTFRKACMGVTS